MTATRTGFFARNRDELALEVISSLVLGVIVAVVLYAVEQSREDARNARDEALGNSLFVRQAVMSEREVLPFSALYLAEAQLSGLDLAGADFSDAVLAGAELKDADLTGADLSEADLTGADLSRSDLSGANLSEADLTGADLTGTVLAGATLDDAVLTGARYAADEPPVGADDALADLAVADDDPEDEDDD